MFIFLPQKPSEYHAYLEEKPKVEFTISTEVKCACKFLMMIMSIFLTLLKTGLEKT
ncbi:hypothetical protein [uncultured Gammaproteobacteria bacterium]|nr:hypothetical protein [uncultured Gammaproteobacteria bacterium]